MSTLFLPDDITIRQEMLAHLPLFSHRKPQTLLIIANDANGIVEECIKHTYLTSVKVISKTPLTFKDDRVSEMTKEQLLHQPPFSLDVIINNTTDPDALALYFGLLHKEGLFLQSYGSLLQPATLKTLQQQLHQTGFRDTHTIHFPQLHCDERQAAYILAIKEGVLRRVREKDIFNKSFPTQFYNLDMHRAAFALPECLRTELA